MYNKFDIKLPHNYALVLDIKNFPRGSIKPVRGKRLVIN